MIAEYLLLLVFAAAICLPGLFSRAISYDESITLLQVAGNAALGRAASSTHPGWPTSPQPVGTLKPRLHGNVSLSEIALPLRRADVHPPLYYWTLSYWRRAFGPSLETARALSLVCSVSAVCLLYAFCAFGGVRYPVLASLTFALASSTADQAQQARSNSMALMLVAGVALVALLLWKHEAKSPLNRFLGFASVALLGAASFMTNYMAAIPAAAIILWLVVVIQRGRAALLIVVAAVGAGTLLVWAPALSNQLSARPSQFAGFKGFPVELASQLVAYANNLLSPAISGEIGRLAFVAGIIAVACLCAFALLRTKSAGQPQFLALLWIWALAPVAGIMTLNVLFDKHLTEWRYFAFAVPAVAVLITYKLGSFRQPLQGLAYSALAALWLSQLLCANWGYELTIGRRAAYYRSLAKSVEAIGTETSVLFAGTEFGDAIPGSLVYELPESLPVVFLEVDSDPLEVAAVLDGYEHVWQVYGGGPTGPVEHAVADRLSELGRSRQPFPDAVLFRRQPVQQEGPTGRTLQ